MKPTAKLQLTRNKCCKLAAGYCRMTTRQYSAQTDQSINQSINQFNSNLAAREPDSKRYAVEIIDKNSKRNKQCAYKYIGAGRDV